MQVLLAVWRAQVHEPRDDRFRAAARPSRFSTIISFQPRAFILPSIFSSFLLERRPRDPEDFEGSSLAAHHKQQSCLAANQVKSRAG